MKNLLKGKNPDQQPQTSDLEMQVSLLKLRLATQIKEQDELDMSSISEFLPAKKAAALLSISKPTLAKLAKTGVLKKHTLGGRKTYYKRNELLSAFISETGQIK